MIKYQDITKSIGDQTVDTLKFVQGQLVDALGALDDVSKQLGSFLPAMPETPTLPVVDSLPTVTDVIEANSALLTRLVAANKEFLTSVSEAIPSPSPATTDS